MLITSICSFTTLISTSGVLRGSVVKCLTCNPGVLGSSHTGSCVFFRGSVLWQDTSEPQPSTGETQEDVNNVNCRRDMTEIRVERSVKHHSISDFYLLKEWPNLLVPPLLVFCECYSLEKSVILSFAKIWKMIVILLYFIFQTQDTSEASAYTFNEYDTTTDEDKEQLLIDFSTPETSRRNLFPSRGHSSGRSSRTRYRLGLLIRDKFRNI